MSRFPGGSVAEGHVNDRQSRPAFYWRAPANSVATPANLAVGSVVVTDIFQIAKATIFGTLATATGGAQVPQSSTTLRIVIGEGLTTSAGTVSYPTQPGPECVDSNVVCADTVAHARGAQALVYTGNNITQSTRNATLAAGEEGMFDFTGQTYALVSITTTLGQRLTVDESTANSRSGTLRAAVDGEHVFAIAREVRIGTATVPVLCLVQLVGGAVNEAGA